MQRLAARNQCSAIVTGGLLSTSVRKTLISEAMRLSAGRHSAKPMWWVSISIALSTSPRRPRAARGATIPSRRDHKAKVGTGGLPAPRANGGWLTSCPATH